MQQESQCKIQMAPDSQGQPTRLCTLTGLPHAVQAAKDQINAVIANDGRGAMKGYCALDITTNSIFEIERMN